MTNDDWKRRACLDAPLSGALLRPDSRVVARPGWYQLITPSAPRGVMNEVVLVATSLRSWAMPAAVGASEHEMYLRAFRGRPRAVHLFIAKVDGDVVGTAGLVVRDDCGYLLGTQVLSSARGRGAYRSLVAARLGFLRKRGIAYAVTQARAATSAPILEHLGFETLFRSSCYLSP